METPKTPFEQAIQDALDGKLKLPNISGANGNIEYFKYQLAVHKFNLSLMANGMAFKEAKFKELKAYYGLKGRSAKDCLPQFIEIMNKYKNSQNGKDK